MDTPKGAALDIQFPKGLDTIETAKLVAYARNARTHSAEQTEQIANSIVEFGFNNPVLVDGENTIIAGHGRVMAAHTLGLETVPIVRLGHLTETQRKAYVLADNQIALNSGWNFDLLAQEVADLNAAGMELDLLGFSDAQIENLLAGLDDPADFLNDMARPQDGGAGDGQTVEAPPPGSDMSAPAAAPSVPLTLVMAPEDRDVVVKFLNGERDQRGLATIAEALVALAAEA